MSDPIGVALIGGGIFIKEEHLPAVLACPLLSLKAIYSRSLKSAQETSSHIPDDVSTSPDLYSDDSGSGKSYNDLLSRPDISAVIIALPIMSQADYVEKALVAGKHVFSEKPIAGTVKLAQKLISFYKGLKEKGEGVTWNIAENFRIIPSFTFARKEIEKLGKIQTFSARVFFMVTPGNKWIETPWRKTPTHQGGFLLDGGVHFSAAIRLLLGPENAASNIIAMSSQIQEYLPPVDTVNALIKTKSGLIGSFLFSVGSTLSAGDYEVACEEGCVTATSTRVVVKKKDGKEEVVKEWDWSSGVMDEVRIWAEGLVAGKPNPLQSPEQALADLELLEAMFVSGDAGGMSQAVVCQDI